MSWEKEGKEMLYKLRMELNEEGLSVSEPAFKAMWTPEVTYEEIKKFCKELQRVERCTERPNYSKMSTGRMAMLDSKLMAKKISDLQENMQARADETHVLVSRVTCLNNRQLIIGIDLDTELEARTEEITLFGRCPGPDETGVVFAYGGVTYQANFTEYKNIAALTGFLYAGHCLLAHCSVQKEVPEGTNTLLTFEDFRK